jgi:serine/threonine-protein kinase
MGQFVPPDRLLYVRGDALFAQRLDLVGLTLVGDPVLVTQPVPVTLAGRAGFSGSNTGVLAHAANVTGASGVLGSRIPTWVDRSGNEEPLGAPARAYSHVRLSPDGTRVALSASDQQLDVWIWTIARKTLTRLTFDSGEDTNPIWTPDSSRILFQSNLKGSVNLYAVASDGTGKSVQLLDGATGPRMSAVSPDGKDLIFEEDANIGGGADLRALPLRQGGHARTIVGDSSSQRSAAISPDGRWIAYNSNESGGWEVYVRPYPSVEAGRWQVSTGGGSQPVWSRDGKELFYVSSDNALMSVPIDARNTWTAGTPLRLQIAPGLVSSQSALAPQGWTYDVSLDGRRFLVLKSAAPEQPEASVRIVVVLNWMRELSGLGSGK